MFVVLIGFGVCILLGIGLILNYLRVVRVQKAFIICSGVTGEVRRVVIGPKRAWVWPLERIVELDLSPQIAQPRLENLVTSDLAVSATLDILYTYDPELLQAVDLNRFLSALPAIPGMIRSQVEHILRSQVAGLTTTELLRNPDNQSELADRLHQKLQARLNPFGVSLEMVQVQCQPAPTMLEAQLSAKRIELKAQARAQALATEAAALGLEGRMIKLLFWGLPPIWSHFQDHQISNN